MQAALPPAAVSRTYHIQTDMVVTIKQQTIRNTIQTTLRQTPYGQPGVGSDAVVIQQLAFSQSDTSPLAQLLTELNPINQHLLFDLSPFGDLMRIRNQSQVVERWQQLKPRLWAKYARSNEGIAFIDAFEHQVYSPDLLDDFRHKGAYGVLLPALFGLGGQVRQGVSSRLIKGFFGPVDLPILRHTTLFDNPKLPNGRNLQVALSLDQAHFDEDQLRLLAKQAMDLPNFEVVHRLEGSEHYALGPDNTLLSASQKLSFVIENCYHNYVQHTLKLA